MKMERSVSKMKHKSFAKRAVACFMAVVMVVFLLPVGVIADEVPDGSYELPVATGYTPSVEPVRPTIPGDHTILFDLADALAPLAPGAFPGLAGALQPFGAAELTLVENADDSLSVYVAGVDSNGDGLTLLLTHLAAMLDLEADDAIVITGRSGANFPTADQGMMIRRSGAWNTLVQVFNTSPAFSISHILASGDLSYNIHIHPNVWGSGVLANTSFFIDHIIISRSQDAGTVDTRDIIYHLGQDSFIQNADLGTTTLGGTPYLQGSGAAAFTVRTYGGYNYLHMGNRSADWHGLDIMLTPMALLAGNTYTIRVSGRVDGEAPTDAAIMLQGNPGFSWGSTVALTTDGVFQISRTLTATELDTFTSIRITTNGAGASMSFFIYTIEVGTSLPATVPPPQPPAGGTPILPDVRWELATDAYYLALNDGDVTTFSGHDVLVRPGGGGSPAEITLIEYQGARFLHITGRTADWHTLDIHRDALEIGDIIRVTGRVEEEPPAGTQMVLGQGGSPWGWLNTMAVSTFSQEFTLQYTVTQATFDATGSAALRIQTNSAGTAMGIFIYNIEIGSVLPARADVPPVPGEPPYIPTPIETVLYCLTLDQFMQDHPHGFSSTGGPFFDGTPYLLHSGSPVFTIVPHPSGTGNSIHMANRVQNFYAVDIIFNALDLTYGAVYTFRASGRATPGVTISLGRTDANWGSYATVTVPASGEWSISHTLTAPQLMEHFIGNQRGVRIMTGGSPTPSFMYIDGIEVVRIGDRGSDYVILPEWDLTAQSLAEAFEQYFLFGNIWSNAATMNAFNTTDGFLHHFNAVTAENNHKVDSIAPNPNTWNFGIADQIVNWAEDNDLAMVGHTLVWHSQSPPWLTTVPGTTTPLTRAQAIENMHLYISTVAGRYAGRIFSWDVLNEVIAGTSHQPGWNNNPNWRAHMRSAGNGLNATNQSQWYNAFANGATGDECGSDFVFYAFRFARIYDPFAILYYNDYNEHVPGKRDAIAAMIVDINTRWTQDPLYDGRLLIEGMGMQSHYGLTGWMTDPQHVRDALELYISTGVRIGITEMDIVIGGSSGSPATPTPALFQAQAARYGLLFSWYLEFSDYIERVSLWGKADHQSWINWGHPLPFDANFRTKPAFYAILDALNNAPAPNISVPVVTTNVIPNAEVGEHFAYQLAASQNNFAPTLWTVTSGQLPAGLRLIAATGVILGTPTQGGVFTFTVAATNAAGAGTRTFTVYVRTDSGLPGDTPLLHMDQLFFAPAAAVTGSVASGQANTNIIGSSYTGIPLFMRRGNMIEDAQVWTEWVLVEDCGVVGATATMRRTPEGFFQVWTPVEPGLNTFEFFQPGVGTITHNVTRVIPAMDEIEPLEETYVEFEPFIGADTVLTDGIFTRNTNQEIVSWAFTGTPPPNTTSTAIIPGTSPAVTWNSGFGNPYFNALVNLYDGGQRITLRTPIEPIFSQPHNPANSIFQSVTWTSGYLTFIIHDQYTFNGVDFDVVGGRFEFFVQVRRSLSANPAQPFEGFTFVLDIGHGNTDPGALGPMGLNRSVEGYRWTEADINYVNVNNVYGLLVGLGANVVITGTPFDPTAGGAVTLGIRRQYAQSARPDAFISFHADAMGNTVNLINVRGYTGWVQNLANQNSVASTPFAAHVNAYLWNLMPATTRLNPNVRHANFGAVNQSWTPAMLIEMAFMTNVEDFRWMIDPANQEIFAERLVDALLSFFPAAEYPIEVAEFSLHAFNNGVINNQSLAGGGNIRIWTRLDGVNALVPYADLTVTATLPNGDCAMHFVNINRPWNNQAYVNFIDANMHAPWQRIYLTATLNEQVAELTLINPRFFSLHAFNNGVINNQSLADSGVIRIWTQLMGANALVPYAGLTVAAVDQDGACAMEFVRINQPWANPGYVNLIDVNFNANWHTIYFAATVFGQTVELVLINPRPPVIPEFGLHAFNNGVINNQSLANAGIIRIWTRLDDANAPVPDSLTVTAVDQDGACAMHLVRVNQPWANPGYVNLIDVNFHANWHRIYLTATVLGQTVTLELINPVPPVDLPEFSLNVFNNGVINNQSLAGAGLIRLWTRLDGVNANVLIDEITAVDQDGECAMEHLRRINTVGVSPQGSFDVNFHAPWQRIYLTVTAYEQTLELTLVNPVQ